MPVIPALERLRQNQKYKSELPNMCKVSGTILNTEKGKRKSSSEVKQGLPAAAFLVLCPSAQYNLCVRQQTVVSALPPHKDNRTATQFIQTTLCRSQSHSVKTLSERGQSRIFSDEPILGLRITEAAWTTPVLFSTVGTCCFLL